MNVSSLTYLSSFTPKDADSKNYNSEYVTMLMVQYHWCGTNRVGAVLAPPIGLPRPLLVKRCLLDRKFLLVQDNAAMYTIDELAHISGMPSRTIRFYNTQGLLPPPTMRGRVAYYSDEHLLILNIIKELREHQHLPLDIIKQMLDIRAKYGDLQMNLELKKRLLRPLTSAGQEAHLSKEALMQQTGATGERIDELTHQGLLFPVVSEGELTYSADDILLLQIYQRLEHFGLPIALPALIRFQLRQLVRSEIAAFEQYLHPRWQEESLPPEQQAEHSEMILTLTDTLISVMHRKLLFQL